MSSGGASGGSGGGGGAGGSNLPRNARAKRAHAKAKQQQRDGTGAGAQEDGSTDGGSSGGDDTAPTRPVYVLFDAREEMLSFWSSELSVSDKHWSLDVGGDEVALVMGEMLPVDGIPPRAALDEIVRTGAMITPIRLAFIEGVYKSGRVDALSDEPSTTFVAHAVLGAVERRVWALWEREQFFLRLGTLAAWWVLSLSCWPLLGRAVVLTLGAGAATICSLAASHALSHPTPAPSRFLTMGEHVLRVQNACVYPLESPLRPVLTRCRCDAFMCALLVLDLARWMNAKQYIVIVILSAVLPWIILAVEKGKGGGGNQSAKEMYRLPPEARSAASADANGLKYLRMLLLGASNLAALYFCWSSWFDLLFAGFFFFPNVTTIAFSSASIGLAGASMAAVKLQSSVIGEYARRSLVYWAVWLAALYATMSGWAAESGWMLWLASWSCAILFAPPVVAYLVQLVGGGACAIVLSASVRGFTNFALKAAAFIGPSLLTKEGWRQIWQLVQVTSALLFELVRGLIKSVIFGAPPDSSQAQDDASSGSTEGTGTASAVMDKSPFPPFKI